jgi:folate-binding protein YgfZ
MNDRWTNYLIEMGAVFSDGRVTGFGDQTDHGAMPQTAGICDLSHYALLKVTGNDAPTFLHNQFTNDVLKLEEGEAQLNGWCTPKGRLIAAFSMWFVDGAYYLLLPRSINTAIQKRLGMFVLRSKVVMEDVSEAHVCIGVVANAPGAWPDAVNQVLPSVGRTTPTAHGLLVRSSASRLVVVAPQAAAIEAWNRLSASSRTLGANAWDLAAVNDGVIEIIADTQDNFVPQMANYELVGGVSFKKGCYPGQEIVARTQYRGILKRRMAKVAFAASASIKAGASVYSPAFPDQAVGTIAMSAMVNAHRCEALVVAQLEAIETDTLFLDPLCNPESKLSIEPLPYRYPAA